MLIVRAALLVFPTSAPEAQKTGDRDTGAYGCSHSLAAGHKPSVLQVALFRTDSTHQKCAALYRSIDLHFAT